MNCRVWFLLCFATAQAYLMAACTGGGKPAATVSRPGSGEILPFITNWVNPAAPAPVILGSTMTLIGNSFGAASGTVMITGATADKHLAVKGADILSWTDSQIVFRLPTKDNSGQPLWSTDPLVGTVSFSVVRADGVGNPDNSDAQGTARPVTIVLTSVGKARVVIDKGGRNFLGQSLEYAIIRGSADSQQTVASFATAFSNEKTEVDLEYLFNDLPARSDYQAVATLYSGPIIITDGKAIATGSIVVPSSPMPLQVSPADTASVTMPIPCIAYFTCQGFSAAPGMASPQSAAAPGGSPLPTTTPAATASPSPTATPPPGVTAETVLSFGTITTIAGTGTSQRLPGSRQFSCTGSTIGYPWATALDSQKNVYFTINAGGIGRVNAGNICEAVILNEAVAGQYLDNVLSFKFAGTGDDLYIADNHLFGSNKWRVIEVKKSQGTYDLGNATNLSFGSTVLEAPTGIAIYKGKLYVASSDDSLNGGGQSYIIEYDLSTRQSRIVAGNGTPGYAGDGGPATSARISPIDIGFGPEGTQLEDLMVIADGGTNSLRAVNLGSRDIDFHGTIIAPGNIATVAGQKSKRYADLLTAPGRDFTNYSFRSWELDAGFSGDGGLATDAQLDWPYGPRFDNQGRLYFIDAGNHRIRVIDKQGIMQTLVGTIPVPANNGQRGWASPNGLNPVKPYPPGANTIPNGDGGPGNQGDLNAPMDMAVADNADATVTLYIAESDSYRMRKVSGLRWQ